jgi:hypothetical protein
MSDKAREALEKRWKLLWAKGRELDARQDRLLKSMETIEEAVYWRAEDQLRKDRGQHEHDLRELRELMKQHGGFEP